MAKTTKTAPETGPETGPNTGPDTGADTAPHIDRDGPAKKVVMQKMEGNDRDHTTWFRGEHTNFNPKKPAMVGPSAIHDHVLHGWMPPEPMITPNTKITAFGSCFASNISEWLATRHFNVLNKDEEAGEAYVVRMGEGMVNTFVIRQQFEWAWENKVFDQPLWHGYKAEEFGYDEAVRLETKRIFDETDFFILTFGLSEVWYDEQTGNVFWRTIPKEVYDPERHRFRVSSVDENRDNMEAIYQLIRKHRPDAKILFTLSPIPLIATFRDVPCLTANSVSKSILRVAVDEMMRAHGEDGHLFYWPSYEIITDVFRLPYMNDRRHPEQATIRYIMTLFEHVWCTGGQEDPSRPTLTEAWVIALVHSGALPPALLKIIKSRRLGQLNRFMANEITDTDPDMEKANRQLLNAVRDEWKARKTQHRDAAE